MPISIAVGLAPAFYPRYSPVGTHDAERIVPAVPRWGAKDFVQDAKQAGSVLFVDTARPRVNGCRFFRREAVQLAKAIIPIYTTGTGIPRPGAPSRGVDGDTEPPFALLLCFLDATTLRDIQFQSGEPDYSSLGIAAHLAQALYPRDGSVGPHDAKHRVKRILHLRMVDLVGDFEHLLAVLLVHTAQPDFKRGWLLGGE